MSGFTSKVAALQSAADKAYEEGHDSWFGALPTEDLTALWGVACAEGADWDDEVHDTLAERGWFDAPVVSP